MRPLIHMKLRVLAGNQIQLSVPQVREGDEVEVIVGVPEEAPGAGRTDIITFLNSLPPGPRSAASWEEFEREFREERDAWDR